MPVGIKRRTVTPGLIAAYRGPLATLDRRMSSYVFPRSIRKSREPFAACEASLRTLAARPALIVWGDADIAFRPTERERFETVLTAYL